MSQDSKEPLRTPLGLVSLPDNTVDRDFTVSDGYQAFSAELLRLALLGVGAIAFLLVQLDPGTNDTPSLIRQNLAALKPWLYVALACLGVCSATALGHRYCSNDGLACHVKYLRLRQRGQGEDDAQVQTERYWRKVLWRTGTWLLAIAALTLAAGIVALSGAFAVAVGLLSRSGAG